jgi:kynurenine formamidase
MCISALPYLRKKNMRLYLDSVRYIATETPIDLSISLKNGEENVRAWYVDAPTMEPVRANGWTGSIQEGGSVNFRDISFNPHGHMTHTECLGHITDEVFSVNTVVRDFFSMAQLVTISPREIVAPDGKIDHVIFPEHFDDIVWHAGIESLIIRTLPNTELKLHMNYSDSNPPYLDVRCIEKINALGIRHLLIDQPSVDRELDGGALAFHHAYWSVPTSPDHTRTITELIFVPDIVADGLYLLEMQLAPFENDAAPSRPVVYEIKH